MTYTRSRSRIVQQTGVPMFCIPQRSAGLTLEGYLARAPKSCLRAWLFAANLSAWILLILLVRVALL